MGSSIEGPEGKKPKVKDKPLTKNISSGISKVLKGLGIVSAISIIANLVLSFKPLMSVVSNIFKMVGMLLRPIASVLMVLLMPILMLLKPIVRSVNQLMRPFIVLAMEFMREGEFGKATATILGGLGIVWIKMSAEFIKFIGTVIISALAGLFGLVSEDAKNQINDNMLPAFYTFVDDQAALMSAGIVAGVAKIAQGSNVGIDKFVNDAMDAIETSYPNISQSTRDALNQVRLLAIEGDLVGVFKTLTSVGIQSIMTFGGEVSAALSGAFAAMIEAATGVSVSSEDGTLDFWSLLSAPFKQIWNGIRGGDVGYGYKSPGIGSFGIVGAFMGGPDERPNQ